LEERQRQSEWNSELREETTISKEHSQHQEETEQGLGNEENYANLTNRSFNDQQYSRLHIYANSSLNTGADASANAEYANQGIVELTKLAAVACRGEREPCNSPGHPPWGASKGQFS